MSQFMGSNMKFIAFLARSAFFADLAPRKCSSSLDALGPGTWDISSLPCGWHMAKWGSACLPAHIPVVVAARLIRIYDSHLFFSFLLSSPPSFRGLWFTAVAQLAFTLSLLFIRHFMEPRTAHVYICIYNFKLFMAKRENASQDNKKMAKLQA